MKIVIVVSLMMVIALAYLLYQAFSEADNRVWTICYKGQCFDAVDANTNVTGDCVFFYRKSKREAICDKGFTVREK